MPHFHPDNPAIVEGIFDTDDRSLLRSGFRLPSDYKHFADDARPRHADTSRNMGSLGLQGAYAEAYERYLDSDNEEIAYE